MSPLATVETDKSVSAYFELIENETKREDSKKLLKLFKQVTGKKPKVWGDNFLIGFGKYKYKRKGGKEEFEWCNTGFAPRKSNITLYLTFDVSQEGEMLEKLGKHRVGKGCLYINRLSDVDLTVLEQLIEKSKDSSWF